MYYVIMLKQKEMKIIINKLLDMVYWLYLKDLKNGNLKNEICSVYKKVVGKSTKKAGTFQQTAFVFKK